MKVLVLGYFGYINNQIDGQTIKTRDVYSLLKKKSKEQVRYFDTQSFKKSKFNIIKMLSLLIKADIVFYLPAHNNLKYMFPLIFCVSKLSNTKINYLVVGGWLFGFLEDKPIHKYMLARIKGIYPETENLVLSLKKYNFNNIYKLYNFRVLEQSNINKPTKLNKKINLVFMARVHPLKGVDLLFKLDKDLKKIGIYNVSIDIYGPIFKDYEDEFFNKIKSSSVNYCGVIEPIKVYDVLSEYDLMIFPTKYFTEGFPGSILDAYISGIPVIATNWLNAKEFIEDGETGLIVDFNNDELFINQTISLIQQPNEIFRLKKNIKIKRNAYSSEAAWKVLKLSMND